MKVPFERWWPVLVEHGHPDLGAPQVADAVRLPAERHRIIAEGARAASVAAALQLPPGSGKVDCVVSGGNLDTSKLTTILEGHLP